MNAEETTAAKASAAQVIWRRELASEFAMGALAARIARIVGPGDLLTLSGDLGAGKTTFARAMIHAVTGDAALEVPSPTFTLMQVYDGPRGQIVHADLYRITNPAELAELGWDEAADGALVLVEWPDRAGSVLEADRLDIAFFIDPARGDTFRRVEMTAIGSFAPRLAREKAIDDVIEASGWQGAERRFMMGDASTRAYERLVRTDGSSAILMISPPKADGPVLRGGKSYSTIARLAETITPFIALAGGLKDEKLSAPEILSVDLDSGVAVLEDLGPETLLDDAGAIRVERYAEAVAVLAALHARDLPSTLPIKNGGSYAIPRYDLEALAVEVELLLEWYAPHVAGAALSSGVRANFINGWRHRLSEVTAAPPTWTLRDYHSPNLLWLPDREGLRRIGLLDFQDCVLGHPAYDVVSLLQDARVTVSGEVELKLLSQYARLRREADPRFDMAAFAQAYAILGAQRATKILGIFARLDKRDGKPHYLAHLPRIRGYLAKSLRHPITADLRAWYETNLPDALASAPAAQ
jgi:tRNA threonylcarbamoyl adenosine modification protein YjeE